MISVRASIPRGTPYAGTRSALACFSPACCRRPTRFSFQELSSPVLQAERFPSEDRHNRNSRPEVCLPCRRAATLRNAPVNEASSLGRSSASSWKQQAAARACRRVTHDTSFLLSRRIIRRLRPISSGRHFAGSRWHQASLVPRHELEGLSPRREVEGNDRGNWECFEVGHLAREHGSIKGTSASTVVGRPNPSPHRVINNMATHVPKGAGTEILPASPVRGNIGWMIGPKRSQP